MFRSPEVGRLALKYSSIVTISRDSKVGRLLVSVSDHLKQAFVFLNAIDCPAGIEDLMPAMPIVLKRRK